MLFLKKHYIRYVSYFCLSIFCLGFSGIEKTPLLLESTTSMKTETRYLVYSMEQLHYSNRPINTLSMPDFIEMYMGDLDSNRMFFQKEDLDDFSKRFSTTLPAYLRQQGNLFPAFEIFKCYKKRVLDRIDWVFEKLNHSFNFNTEDKFEPDRKKALWETSDQEMQKIWNKRLQYEILNEVLSDKEILVKNNEEDKNTPKTDEEKLEKAKETLKKRYKRFKEAIESIDATDIQEIFLSSLAHMYDPHSTFYSSDSMDEFSIAIKNALVGIGVVLFEEDGYCTIKELLPNGPAEKSKQIKPTDKIVAVGNPNEELVDVVGMRQKNIVKLIRGKEGSPVCLLIQPADMDPSKVKKVTLTREEIKLTSQLAKAQLYEIPYQGTKKTIGVIELPAFYGSSDGDLQEHTSTHDVEELIIKLQKLNVEGIILDLRRNQGGLFTEAINLSGLFIPSGTILQVKDTLGQVTEYKDFSTKIAWPGPLLILTSRYSASSSEIVVGALKNYNRALIVGDPSTHGKGTVQVIFEMDKSLFNPFNKTKMGSAKITVQKWYLPNGDSIQVKGIESDIILPSINPYLPIGESDYPNYLQWDSIPPIDIDKDEMQKKYLFKLNQDIIQSLNTLSKDRQNKLIEFKYLKESVDWFKEKQKQKIFSLNLEEREKQKKEDDLFKEKIDKELKELSKEAYPYKEIILDVAAQNTSNKEDDEKKEEDPDIDVHLRESLRIMSDWLSISEK